MGQKQKTEKKERKKEKRLNDGNNNGQATHGARMSHTSRLGQKRAKVSVNNGQYILGSGENWNKWVLIGPDSFSGGFSVLEHNKSENKTISNFFL